MPTGHTRPRTGACHGLPTGDAPGRYRMKGGPSPPQFPAPVAGLERHVKWRIVAIGVFLAMLAGLLAVATWDRLTPQALLVGLPDDPDVEAARELVRGLTPAGSELRFESA